MQPHPSVAARRPLPLGSGPRCRRVGGCPFGLLLGLWATLAAGAEPVEADERAAALPAAPILRVATVPEPRDERPDAEAERARRAALELPPRLVLEPMTPPSAALASARTRASASRADDRSRREDVAAGDPGAPEGTQGAERSAARDADRETAGASARPAAAAVDDVPPEMHAAGVPPSDGPPRLPPAGADDRVPAVRAAAFASGRGDMGVSEAAADEPAAAESRAAGSEYPTPPYDGSPRELRTDTLSLVVGGFLPRPATARGGREGRAGETPRPGLARPSGPRGGLGSAPSAGTGLPRESSDRREEASRDWKLERGRWGFEHGGRLNMELEGYRLSLKPRRSGLVLSIRRSF